MGSNSLSSKSQAVLSNFGLNGFWRIVIFGLSWSKLCCWELFLPSWNFCGCPTHQAPKPALFFPGWNSVLRPLVVWNLIDPWMLPILWRQGLEKKRGKKVEWCSWNSCQFANEAKRAWGKLGPSCRAHQSLKKSKNALGEVSIRPAHKNTGLSPLKPFLSWILPISFSLCCIWELRPTCAALSPQNSPGYECQLCQIFVPLQLSPQHGFIGSVF